MKKLFISLICISLTLTSCTLPTSKTLVGKPNTPNSIEYEDYDAKQKLLNDNPISDSFVESLNTFTFNSSSLILSEHSTENINYSPLSFYFALSLAAIGADDITKEEFLNVLNIPSKDTTYLTEQLGMLFRILYSDNDIKKLKLANSLWLSNDYTFNKEYIDAASNNLYASIYNVDFNSSKTNKLISNWIKKNTNDFISPQVEVDSKTVMSIINTIYYSNQWDSEFNESETKKDTFYLYNDTTVSCDFMSKTFIGQNFVKGSNYISSEIPLKDSGTMVFILPDDGINIDDLVSSSNSLASLFDNSNSISGEVVFQIPKFDFESKFDLKNTAKALGINIAFTDTANFNKITSESILISDIKQESRIAIDEQGIEAAAFTQINLCGTSMPVITEKAELILNRPFIYGIKDSNDVLLFIGICNNPLN